MRSSTSVVEASVGRRRAGRSSCSIVRGPDDRRRHRRVLEHPRHGQVGERHAGVGRHLRAAPRRGRACAGSRAGRSRSGPARARPARRSARRSPRRYLPVSQPPAERAPRDHAHAVALARRQHGRLDAAGEDRVRRLLAAEPLAAPPLGHPLRLDDQLGRVRRAAEHPHLALVHEVAQSAPSVSSRSTVGSGRWAWYRSM